MRTSIWNLRRGDCGCCPGHDTFPHDSYNNSRSKHARSRDKKVEHQLARTIEKRRLLSEIKEAA